MSINSKKEYTKQLEFIKEYIQNRPLCKLNNYYMTSTESTNPYKFELISVKTLKNILSVLYTSGDAMESVCCFFDALFNQTQNQMQNKTIYDFNLNKTVKKWLKNSERYFTDNFARIHNSVRVKSSFDCSHQVNGLVAKFANKIVDLADANTVFTCAGAFKT